MAHSILLADLTAQTADQRNATIDLLAIAAAAPTNGQAIMVEARIRAFEEKYEMSSVQLVDSLARDAVRETADISEWLFWLQLRERRKE